MKYLAIFCLILIPTLVLGATYSPLVGIPGVSNSNTDFNLYINSIYALSIGIAALLAVIKIIIAGVKWMLTDVVTSKEDAKKDIKGALIGLLIVLSAVLVISVINKDILSVDMKFNAPANITPSTPASQAYTESNLTSIKDVTENVQYFELKKAILGNSDDQYNFTRTCYGLGYKPEFTHSTAGSGIKCLKPGPTGLAKTEDWCFKSCDTSDFSRQEIIDWCDGGTLALDVNEDDYIICTK